MNFEQWYPFYKKIIHDFNFSEEQDIFSAKKLNEILKNNPHTISFDPIETKITGNDVIIFGAGPSIEDMIKKYKHLIENCVIIAADGATSALIQNEIIPDIIVSDLDGKISDQLYANTLGSIYIVHAHGDNIESIENIVPQIKNTVCGTIQTNPTGLKYVSNVGGFTDGDRAVFLADHFNAKQIYLIGFEFTGEIGSYSFKSKNHKKIKLKKLQWAKRLISILNTKQHIKFLQ